MIDLLQSIALYAAGIVGVIGICHVIRIARGIEA
jgi:hypothetical protein